MNVTAIVIRLAVPDELRALEALQTRASLSNPGDREAILGHTGVNEIPESQIEAGRVFVAEGNGTAIGFAVVLPRSDGETELDGLFVEPELWRQGIGRRLVDQCVQIARSLGSAALHVVGNPHAEGFYVRCGFTRVGTVKLRFGIGLLLRKLLR